MIMNTYSLALISVLIVSLVSFVGVLTLSLRRQVVDRLLLLFVSLSAGTLFGGAFLHLLPEAVETEGFTLQVSLLILAGVLLFFILEKFIHWHHCHTMGFDTAGLEKHTHKHSKQHIGILNLLGDGLHNLLDGLIIAGSYLVSVPVGIATTLAVIIHEVPQEIADFGILLYAGWSHKKALFLNFLSAAVAILGTVLGLLLGSKGEWFAQMIIPIAAGGFVYIAGANLIPELHKQCDLKSSIWHIVVFILGIGLMFGLLFLE